MPLLNILQYPDPRLKKVASSIAIPEINTKYIQDIVNNMFETMYQAKGVGLAATQVDIHLQIITIDVSNSQNQPLCVINPKIINQQEKIISVEGCLSFPGIYANIPRYKLIDVKFIDRHGKMVNLSADDLLSICLQHEIDHINGKTFFDHLSPLKKNLLEKKLKKLRTHNL